MIKDDTQFAHILGRIRSQEAKMLNENEVERMIGATNVKEAFKVLNETGFSNHVLDIDNVSDFQKVINAEMLETANFLKKLSPCPEYLNVLWYMYDIHNIKTLLKGKFEKIWEGNIDELLNPLGSLDLDKLKAYFRTEGAHFPNTMFETHKVRFVETIKKIEAEYAKDENYQMIDFTLDKLYFELMSEIANESTDEFLIKFTIKNIDLFNIGALFRLKLKGVDADSIKKTFATGGILDVQELGVLTERNASDIPTLLKETHYKTLSNTIIEEFQTSKTMIKIDELGQNHMTDFVKEAKSITYGIAPVIAFFWAKNNNAQILRMILLAKIANINPELIKKHIRNLY
ncbi:MAG: V-type ATPase subunit [Candidatus Peregrinibacteria bacterium]|nr:V-type ATPase subunit [Candidatus Peregrinibacteria bacterium]MDZ4245292.1 V-type ATPase subunit [Candidatus Gracilibacteria bacterium]